MIFDHITHRDCYSAIPGLKEILEQLSKIDETSFPTEPIVLNGDRLFINPVVLDAKAFEDTIFEAHQRYADIHYIVSGCEEIVVSDVCALKVETQYNKDKDVSFHTGSEGTVCVLKPGDFLVCFPQDAHRVAISTGQDTHIVKLVGKMKVSD